MRFRKLRRDLNRVPELDDCFVGLPLRDKLLAAGKVLRSRGLWVLAAPRERKEHTAG
jgi:hypothetical protein